MAYGGIWRKKKRKSIYVTFNLLLLLYILFLICINSFRGEIRRRSKIKDMVRRVCAYSFLGLLLLLYICKQIRLFHLRLSLYAGCLFLFINSPAPAQIHFFIVSTPPLSPPFLLCFCKNQIPAGKANPLYFFPIGERGHVQNFYQKIAKKKNCIFQKLPINYGIFKKSVNFLIKSP